MVAIVVAIVVVLALVGGGAFALTRKSTPSLSGLTADQALNKVLAAARSAGTVHIVGTQTDSGVTTQATMDIGSDRGEETVTMDGESATLLAVNGQVYFQADAGFLADQSGVPTSIASAFADKWFSIPATTDGTGQVVEMLEMSGLVDQELALSGPLHKVEVRAGPVPINGTVPNNDLNQDSAGDPATLSVSRTSPFLPQMLVYGDSSGFDTSLAFSKWGEKLTLAAPASAIPIPDGISNVP